MGEPLDKAEFDRYAQSYQAQHAANIAITGEAPEYFSRYKVQDASRICRLLKLLPNNIVDFGCGIGNATPYFAEFFPTSKLWAADVSEKSLDLLERRHPGAASHLLIENSHIDVPENFFDLAFTACVFHHIDHLHHQTWLEELHRIVRPGGLLVLFEHNPYNPLTRHAVNTCPFDANAKLVTASRLSKSVMAAGWGRPKCWHRVFFPNSLAAARPAERWLRWLPLGAQYCLFARA